MAQTAPTGIPPIGTVIRAWRIFREFTSTELAEEAGVRIGYLSEIEHNRTANPKEEYLVKLADALRVPLQDIYGRRMPPQSGEAEEKDKDAGGKELGGVQPALGQQTRKTATPGTRLNSPLTTLPQEILKHRLAMLEMRLEAAEKNLHEAHEELRELGALAGQDQQPNFAKRLYLQIIGPASEVQSIFDEVEARKHPNLKVASAPREYKSMFKRHKYGYKARLCGTVEFTGHVSEKLAHDYIKSLIEGRFPQSRIEVKVSENIENL